jgi:LysR family transcriptional regulator, glycine cleavage system transcriptional activator
MRKAARIRLPPMSTLEAFDAAARLGSLSAAAAALNLTPGAVSRQMAALEGDLGVALFARGARGVELTLAGRRFQTATAEALKLVLAATGDLRRRDAGGTVRVSVTPSFGARWLLPRLARFHAANPSTTVVPVAENRLVDLEREQFDISVRYSADPRLPTVERVLLIGEELVPVAAPALLGNRPRTQDGLVGLPFLHDTSDAFWRLWLAAAGRPELLPAQGTVFNDYNLAIGAAVSGLGVLIGRTALIQNELRSGALVEAVPFRVPSERRYWLLRPSTRPTHAAAAFWTWLIAVADENAP